MVATSLETVGIVLAALGGIALAVQAGVNSSLGRNVGIFWERTILFADLFPNFDLRCKSTGTDSCRI